MLGGLNMMNQKNRKIYEIKDDLESKSTSISASKVVFEQGKVIILPGKKSTFKLYFHPYSNRDYYVLICDNLLDFDTAGYVWLLKFKNDWSIFNTYRISWYLTADDANKMLHLIRENIMNFNRFNGEKVTIRKDLEYQINFGYHFLNIDGIDYRISDKKGGKYYCDEGKLELTKLGILQNIPGNNWFSIVKNEKGKYIYGCNWKNYPDVQEIEEFRLNQYPKQFSYENDFRLFWLKDSKNQIRGLAMIRNCYNSFDSFYLDDPISQLDFVRRIKFENGNYVDIWKITFTNKTQKILVKHSYGTEVLFSKEELFDE